MIDSLAELFTSMANAIRTGLGEIGGIKPEDMPTRTLEIVDLIGTGGGGTGGGDVDCEAINDVLDEINGEVIGETLYTVTFIGDDGAELCKVPVYDGNDCNDPVVSGIIEAPKKEPTKYIGYRYAGWSSVSGGEVDSTALQNVTANRTVYAVFTEYEIMLAEGYAPPNKTSARWKINPDYVLTLYGSGVTGNYYASSSDGANPPWNDYTDQIVKVVIEQGITGVGLYSFKDMTSLTEVMLPSGLRTIGTSAFENCASLTNITIPSSVKLIQNRSFTGAGLKSAVFERTSGWIRMKYNNENTTISESVLQNPASAASLLLENHSDTFENTEL